VYTKIVKKRELEKILKTLGWWFLREGGNHEIWTNGKHTQPIPRHKELKEWTARGILRFAASHPPEKNEGDLDES